ncbi:hypothetical protein B0H15DRAFT_263552 [Mycena belliarum]|uniref:Uncharacterized protein n=1 Tax=Mycena belliarum TaxID=1033014 RepID=A0AAD6U5Y4_9AGAR|nr:hypothetical protein B0H15DRAFT_263552 [Mycena belliae]
MESWPALPSRFLSSRDVRGEDAGSVATATPLVDAEGRPIPPPGAVRIQDPELISLLSDPGIMNGADGRRQSVWSMLDAIAPPSRRVAESLNGEDEYAGSDRSSIMMYSPLIPSADSIIELAELEEAPVTQAPSSSGMWLSALWPASSWSAVWPFTGWKTGTVAEEQDNATTSTTEVLEPGSAAGQLVERHDPPVPVTRVWVPSTTQLSFETMWWGYRIYIPPPVLDILDDQSVEAAKQATTLTAALTWFFSNLPITAFPPPLQPAMLLLQRLTPVTSYIGTFISWSWSTIRGFDRGHGVILTATWLLPIALIPGTWHARDVPPPTNSSSPTPGSESGSAVFVPLSPPPYVELDPELLLPIPPAPMLPPVPLPPDDAPPPPPLRERKQKKKGMSTLRKLTRTLT